MTTVAVETQGDSTVSGSDHAMPVWLARQRDTLLLQRGHAWLLHGPSGLGQYDLALGLAQSWLCEAQGSTGTQAACGQCASCRMLASRAHTDLVVLMPETLMIEHGWPLSEKAQKEIDDKSRKPSREIRVEAMRESIEFAQLTSGRGRGKVVVVYPAERMNLITANALLKTLEEPGGDLKFVLASESVHQLLPTIRSRCQSFALQWPSANEALQWMQSQSGVKASPQALAAALAAAGGRPLDAARYLTGDALAAWTQLPKGLVMGSLGGGQALAANWTAKTLLDALQKLCHDLWAVKLGAVPRFFAATDLPKPPPARALSAWSEQLKTLALSIEHTWKTDLLLEDLISQARSALNSRQ